MCERSSASPHCSSSLCLALQLHWHHFEMAAPPMPTPPLPPTSPLFFQLLMTFLSAMTVAFCNLGLAQTERLWIIDQKIEAGKTLCAVVSHEELPYVAWFAYKWTIALREKSLLRVNSEAVSLSVKKALHRISSCTLSIRLEEHRKCTIQVVSRRKHPDYLICTCFEPPHRVSISNTQVKKVGRLFFGLVFFSFFLYPLRLDIMKNMFWLAVACRSYCCFQICCYTWNLYSLPGPYLHDHLMCEQFLFSTTMSV